MLDEIDMPNNDTIRDARKPGFYMVDNVIIDHYITLPIVVEVRGKEKTMTLGVTGLGVYNVLSRYANKEKRSWPGIRRIAHILKVAPNTVITYLALLEKANLIQVVRATDATGQHLHNEYILLDVAPMGGGVSTSDTPPPIGGVSPSATRVSTIDTGVYQPARHGVSPSATEQYLINKTQSTRPNNKTSSSPGDDEESLPCPADLLSDWLASETGYDRTKIRAAIAEAIGRGRDPHEIEDAMHGWLTHCRRTKSIKVPGALIAQRIRENRLAPKEDRDAARLTRSLLPRYSVLDAEQTDPDEEMPEPEVDVVIPSRNGADHTWEISLSQLRLQMTQSTWETWLRDATARRDGATLTIILANQYAYDWVSKRLGKIIERTVTSIDPAITTIAYAVRNGATP